MLNREVRVRSTSKLRHNILHLEGVQVYCPLGLTRLGCSGK